MKVLVKCEYQIEVDVPDGVNPIFYVEDNGCPGTGQMGTVLEDAMDEHDKASTCWACALKGKCTVMKIMRGQDG